MKKYIEQNTKIEYHMEYIEMILKITFLCENILVI